MNAGGGMAELTKPAGRRLSRQVLNTMVETVRNPQMSSGGGHGTKLGHAGTNEADASKSEKKKQGVRIVLTSGRFWEPEFQELLLAGGLEQK